VSYGFHAAYMQIGGDMEADKQFLKDLFTDYNAGKINDDVFIGTIAAHLSTDTEHVKMILAQNEHVDLRLFAYIKSLKKNYKIAMLSNVGRGGMERYFKDVNLDEYFNEIILSGEVGLTKPSPEIFALTAERLNVKQAECVFIDDGEMNCSVASSLGFRTILHRNEKAEDFLELKSEIETLLAGADH